MNGPNHDEERNSADPQQDDPQANNQTIDVRPNDQFAPQNEADQPLLNDLYHQIIEDANQNPIPPKKHPGIMNACLDFNRVTNVIRMINLGGFITSTVFIIIDWDSYFYCVFPLIFCWIVYWIDIFCFNSTFKSLNNIQLISNLYEHIEDVIRNGKPIISFEMECYHFETRYRTVTRTDSNGRSYTTTESYQEKVVTWRGSDDFTYSKWTDESEMILGLEEFIYTRVQFHKKYILHDDHTKNEFSRQRQSFINMNKDRDTHYNVWDKFTITGYIEYAISSLKSKLPWMMNVWWYLFFCYFMLELLYSLYISFKTGKKHMTYVKRIMC